MIAILSYAAYAAATLVGFTVLLGLAAFVTRMPILAFAARSLTSYICMLISAAYGVFAGIFLHAFGNPSNAQWATGRCFKYLMWYTTGVTFEIVEGKEHMNTRPAVLIGNHQTELDVLFLGCIFPQYCSVTSKKSLQYVPILGWFMALSNTVFIDRANRSTALAAFEKAASVMKSRSQSVFIFPEGTRSYATGPTLLPFKKGAFHLAVQAGVDIIPVVSETYSEVLDVKTKQFNAGTVKVKVLPPIPTKGLTAADVDELCQSTRAQMLDALVELAQRKKSNAETSAVASGVEGNGATKRGVMAEL